MKRRRRRNGEWGALEVGGTERRRKMKGDSEGRVREEAGEAAEEEDVKVEERRKGGRREEGRRVSVE